MNLPRLSVLALVGLVSCSDRSPSRTGLEALRMGDGERAARQFGVALDRDPTDSVSRRGLGMAWLLVARDRSADGEDHPSDWSRSVRELERCGRDSILSASLEEARLGWAKSLAQAGDTARAMRRLESVLQESPRANRARNLLAILHDRQGDHDRAADLFLQITAIDSLDADAWFNLGLVEWGRGRKLEASGHLIRAAKLNPTDPEILFWLGRVSDLEGDR